jgi:hypothetical protein
VRTLCDGTLVFVFISDDHFCHLRLFLRVENRSGKTLAFLLPLLRSIMVQPDLAPGESGPIGLILAPARELAYQIHLVCKSFAKQLGLK